MYNVKNTFLLEINIYFFNTTLNSQTLRNFFDNDDLMKSYLYLWLTKRNVATHPYLYSHHFTFSSRNLSYRYFSSLFTNVNWDWNCGSSSIIRYLLWLANLRPRGSLAFIVAFFSRGPQSRSGDRTCYPMYNDTMTIPLHHQRFMDFEST